MSGKLFHFVMIKPSHYDDDGYVIQFMRSAMPSNTLATLYGLAVDCARRKVLGDDVEFRFTTIDETNTRVDVRKLVREIRRSGDGLVGLVGVQSNQFPRALDLARAFRSEGIDVCIGGFHVSGCISMLPDLTPELQEALDLGVSLFAGEAEGRLDTVLRDAFRGELRPIYDYLADLPSIVETPPPILPAVRVKRTAGAQASFDAGRGCPFRCSFCTIINVQGRTSRVRRVEDVERIIRLNLAEGIRRFFITDDNFARNRDWEAIFDRLIEIREREGLRFNLVIQVDTLCHKLEGFVEKAARAGVRRVFIGLENINPESLVGSRKNQNRVAEYRRMLQAWRRQRVVTVAGYILGFPGDTVESIARDIEIVKAELPIDILEFFFLTPLPGSEDHLRLYERGDAMDADLNRYDLNHVTTSHDAMSRDEWERACRVAWDTFYTPQHIETLMRRAHADGVSAGKVHSTAVAFYCSVLYEGVHPLESGLVRLRYRRDRRPGLPLESPIVFYAKHWSRVLRSLGRAAAMYLKYYPIRRRLRSDPNATRYVDRATAPAEDDDPSAFEMLSADAGLAAERVRVTR